MSSDRKPDEEVVAAASSAAAVSWIERLPGIPANAVGWLWRLPTLAKIVIAIWVVGLPFQFERNWRLDRAHKVELQEEAAKRAARFQNVYVTNKTAMAAKMDAARQTLRDLGRPAADTTPQFERRRSQAIAALEAFYADLYSICLEKGADFKCPDVAAKGELCALARSDLALEESVPRDLFDAVMRQSYPHVKDYTALSNSHEFDSVEGIISGECH